MKQPPPDLRRRILLLVLAAFLLAFSPLGFNLPSAQAAALKTKTPKSSGSSGYSPYDVIAAVNSLRAANGLPAYQVNAALMAAAQSHSDYQASIGSITHSGAGGSNPKGRAIAYGYGGGANVGVTENIYGGGNASPQQAVNWWQGDSLHLNTMLGAQYTDVGAGIAVAGGTVYYTLDVGYIAGGAIPTGSSTGSGTTTNPAAVVPGATPVAFNQVIVATPGPDGSIVHTVQAGQSLWTIAAVYKIELPELLRLNGMGTNAYIFPGDKLIIKLPEAQPDLATEDPQPSPTFQPTREKLPTSTPQSVALAQTPLAGRSNTIQPPAVIDRQSKPAPLRMNDPLLWVIGSLVVGGTILMVAGNLLKRRA